jgi:hypothetical protein
VAGSNQSLVFSSQKAAATRAGMIENARGGAMKGTMSERARFKLVNQRRCGTGRTDRHHIRSAWQIHKYSQLSALGHNDDSLAICCFLTIVLSNRVIFGSTSTILMGTSHRFMAERFFQKCLRSQSSLAVSQCSTTKGPEGCPLMAVFLCPVSYTLELKAHGVSAVVHLYRTGDHQNSCQ